jgi:hypothetical protein
MGYKTKSMIYAKSLKASLNATSEKGNPQAEAFKSIGLGYAETNTPERSNIEKKMTSKPVSLIKKAPETKAEPTKREKRKSAKKGVDSGVLSGLAGSKGTQTGTAIGIIAKKIAGAVKGKKGKAKAAAATSAANKARGFSETTSSMPIKKADNFRFYEDSGMNKSTPKKKVVNEKAVKKAVANEPTVGNPSKSFGIMNSDVNKPTVGKPSDSKGVMKSDGKTSFLKSDVNKSILGTFIQEGIKKSPGVKANPKKKKTSSTLLPSNQDFKNLSDKKVQDTRKAKIIALRKSQGYK